MIDDEGVNHGTVPTSKALQMAKEKDLDLVVVSANQAPPVAKILDWGKYKYETEKRAKEAKKNQKQNELKKIWLSMTIDVGDIAVKSKQCLKFLDQGNKVKVSIRMKGRENARAYQGVKVMEDFFAGLNGKAVQDKKPTTEGRFITMMLSPAKN